MYVHVLDFISTVITKHWKCWIPIIRVHFENKLCNDLNRSMTEVIVRRVENIIWRKEKKKDEYLWWCTMEKKNNNKGIQVGLLIIFFSGLCFILLQRPIFISLNLIIWEGNIFTRWAGACMNVQKLNTKVLYYHVWTNGSFTWFTVLSWIDGEESCSVCGLLKNILHLLFTRVRSSIEKTQ